MTEHKKTVRIRSLYKNVMLMKISDYLFCSFVDKLLQGNYADAISCYNEVLRIDPLAADGLVNRGNTYKEIGRVSEAIQDYIRAIAVRPTMAEAHANLASAYKDRLADFKIFLHDIGAVRDLRISQSRIFI